MQTLANSRDSSSSAKQVDTELGATEKKFSIFMKNSTGFSISCEVAELRLPLSPGSYLIP